jgi:3-deoxy-D-manno-octulosonic-acid transferase
MSLWKPVYNFLLVPAARAFGRLAAGTRPKLAAGLAGRRQTFPLIESYLAAHGSPAPGSAVLFHASSVGEYLQAVPLMERIRKADPDKLIFLSYFSPSVENRARNCPYASLAFYLPEDTAGRMRRLLGLLKPGLIVVSKFDIWPNLVWQAQAAGIPVAVTAGTLSPDSGRISGIAASFHRSFYRYLKLVCAISAGDAENFARLGVERASCVVTGDTRFDQTWARAAGVSHDDPLVRPFHGWRECKIFAAGSIWPTDQEHLLPALAKLCEAHPELRLILAPHEPSPEHTGQLTEFCDQANLSYERYSEFKTGTDAPGRVRGDTRVVLVDTVGALAAVYRAADLAYVGGSFGPGVHNTMEPACFGLPLTFGPRHLNSYEARLMVSAGGAFPVENAEQLAEVLGRLITGDAHRQKSGAAARKVVEDNLGATEKTIRALAEKFPGVVPVEQ